ncbi:MAG: hypothetical protein GTN78_14320, partial [Gemmatimonadales bacterium]|nr:hypothetical protein [Gemmatimonadales bacterium]
RAESGGPILGWIPYLNPALMLIRLAGPQAFAPRRLTAMSLHNWYLQYGWDQPMPYGMEALKMAEESRRSQRRFFIAVVAAAAIGIFGTVFVELNFAYRLGEAAQFNKTGWDVLNIWRRLDIWLSEPTSGNLGAVGGMLLGAGLTLFLAMMRVHHIGWVLHPVPFVTTAVGGWFVGFFWLPFLIAWCIKLVIVRYWGLSGFRKSLPFFFGLIMGEMAGGMMWPLYGLLTNTKCYSFFA